MKRKKTKKELRENSGIWFYPSAREDHPLTKGHKSQAILSLMAEVLENWDLRIWDFRLRIGHYLRQKKLYKLQAVSEHISKITISYSNTVPPSPHPPLADSQGAQTEALGAGKRQVRRKPKDNCLLHFGSENPILEVMGEATKNSLHTISKENIFCSDCTCPSLPLQPHWGTQFWECVTIMPSASPDLTSLRTGAL